MLVINLFHYKIEKIIINYLFISYIIKKNIIANNISIFENFNINQLKYNKKNLSFKKYFIVITSSYNLVTKLTITKYL